VYVDTLNIMPLFHNLIYSNNSFISTSSSILSSLWLITDYLHGTVHSTSHATLSIANCVRLNMERDNLGAASIRCMRNYNICLQELDLILKI